MNKELIKTYFEEFKHWLNEWGSRKYLWKQRTIKGSKWK